MMPDHFDHTVAGAGRDVLAALQAALGDAVLAGEAIPTRNLRDWSSMDAVRPLAVVRPDSTEGVATAMRVCARHGVAVVPQGGLTGLCGGALPIAGAIALSLERLTGIEEIDPAASTITVRAGTPLEAVQQAASDAGFLMPLDLGARGSCAIGGNISTNAGGNRVLRYGMAREMVLGLEVVLPDGTIMTSLNKMLKNNAGYDLRQLFIGSEGTLGIVTRAVLRLFPQPASVSAALCGVASYAGVLALLDAARRELGAQLSAFEVMWPDYWRVVTGMNGVRNPLAGEHALTVLVETHGSDAAIDPGRFQDWLERQAEAGTVVDAAVAQSIADVQAFWRTRDAAGEFVQVLGVHESFDIGLPVGAIDDFTAACRDALQARLPGVIALFYGHVADGNLHIVSNLPGAATQPKQAIQETVYGTVQQFGGTVSAEHGIGLSKKRWLPYTRNPVELDLMRTIKRALDPAGLLNPGKVF